MCIFIDIDSACYLSSLSCQMFNAAHFKAANSKHQFVVDIFFGGGLTAPRDQPLGRTPEG